MRLATERRRVREPWVTPSVILRKRETIGNMVSVDNAADRNRGCGPGVPNSNTGEGGQFHGLTGSTGH